MAHNHVNDKTHKHGWTDALQDAKLQLQVAKRRVRELSDVVRVCEERVRTGEPWPTDAAEGTAD